MPLVLPRSDEVFSYYPPDKSLSPYIAYYSVQHKFFAAINPLFIPDLGGSLIVTRGSHDLDLTMWGPFDRLTAIEQSRQKIAARYFVEFQPGGISRFVHPNSAETLNRKIPLDEINMRMNRSLREIFEKNFGTGELILSLDRYFLRLLYHLKDSTENGRHILDLLRDFGANITAKDLSFETNYSARHINRYMNAVAGLPAKKYIRIKRFNQAAEMLKHSGLTVERIAYALDYYDAAHFVRDFEEISGLSPASYRKNMSGFYNETLKNF
jgi:AraC-like DNA-binding protein